MIGIAGEAQLDRDVARQHPGKAEQPTGGRDERTLHLGDAERRGRRRDDHVARQHDLGTTGERRTVDRCDEGLGARPRDDPAEPTALGLQVAGLALVDRLEVRTGAEHVALGREHTQPDVGVLLELIERCFHAAARRRR